MTTKAFMIQGTGSNVGKSLLVAGLCRHYTNKGLSVRPFKPQNMSNNAAVTIEGGEIGRAQALQALACRTEPSNHMNPVLLKPEGDNGSQLIVHGKSRGTMKARDYYRQKSHLMADVMASYEKLQQEADLIIVEGAGSASEVNLRANDIANMGFALTANLPVYLAADIDRGGVIAALVGTAKLLPQAERALIKGFIINKFRGDPALFNPALSLIEEQTGWPSLGILPWFDRAVNLPAEDSQDLEQKTTDKTGNEQLKSGETFKIIVPRLPRISNFDDLDPLHNEPDVQLLIVEPGTPLPRDANLIILPGSKATRADLAFLKSEGWHIDIAAHIRQGGAVLGLCGGYQMLGQSIDDPGGAEGAPGTSAGLGHLNTSTTMAASKTLTPIRAIFQQQSLTAYEMHIGQTSGPDCQTPLFITIEGRPEGAISPCGRIMGTYLHGLFQEDAFRRAFLQHLGAQAHAHYQHRASVEQTLDALADHLATHLDLPGL